jgi:hypothetical protein
MISFKVGQTYQIRFIGDSELIVEATIVKKTAKRISFTEGDSDKIKTVALRSNDRFVEFFYPMGTYSMAPTCYADKLIQKDEIMMGDVVNFAEHMEETGEEITEVEFEDKTTPELKYYKQEFDFGQTYYYAWNPKPGNTWATHVIIPNDNSVSKEFYSLSDGCPMASISRAASSLIDDQFEECPKFDFDAAVRYATDIIKKSLNVSSFNLAK